MSHKDVLPWLPSLTLFRDIQRSLQYPNANHGAGIFASIYPKSHPNVGKYTSTMDHMGYRGLFKKNYPLVNQLFAIEKHHLSIGKSTISMVQ